VVSSVGSRLILSGRAPAAAESAPNPDSPGAGYTITKSLNTPAQSPQRQRTSSNLLAPALAQAPSEPPRSPRAARCSAPPRERGPARGTESPTASARPPAGRATG